MITTDRRGVVAAAVAMAAGGIVLLASQASAAVDDFTVVSTTYSVSSVTVSGLDTTPVTATVHITDSTPLPTQDFFLWFAFNSATGYPAPGRPFAGAKLVSGSGSDGVWAATMLIPSTMSGTFTLGQVFEGPPTGDNPNPVDHLVSGGPSFTVIGTHVPRLTAQTVPAILPPGNSPFRITGRAVDSSTGLGMAGVELNYSVDGECIAPSSGIPTTTNSTGFYAFPPQTDPQAKRLPNCVWFPRATPQADGSQVLILEFDFIPTIQGPQVSRVPTGGVQTGDGSTARLHDTRLLTLGAVLLLPAAISALVWRRRPEGAERDHR